MDRRFERLMNRSSSKPSKSWLRKCTSTVLPALLMTLMSVAVLEADVKPQEVRISKGSSASQSPRGPSGCPLGVSPKEFVCYTLVEEAKAQDKVLDLEGALNNVRFDLLQERAKRLKRVGWNLGPGLGIGFDGEPQGGIYATFGWRFR